MSAVFAPQHSVPPENWDDDFEFHANSAAAATAQLPTSTTRASTASSNITEDWDHDSSAQEQPRPSTSAFSLEDKENLRSVPGPSTPSKRPYPHTENWDDDFEDKTDSPGRKTPSRKSHKKSLTSRQHAQETENWDDDFEVPTSSSRPDDDNHFLDHDHVHSDDDDDMDLGFADKDEDRTVTARSRRAGISQQGRSPLNSTPPPPVPPLPFSLLTHDLHGHDQPFPRSPTASVFSAPSLGSGRDSVAFSYYHNNSTTHLRPTVSRSTLGGLSNLPPSPPIHKERERRRLRKKSRPHPEAVYELVDRKVSLDTSQEGDDHVTRVTPPPSSTPPPTSPPPQPLSTPSSSRRHSVTLSSSPPSKTPLLSRIGSVKKWGVRKKRASTTPSEVSLQEMDHSNVSDHGHGSANDHTPRPPSSAGVRPGWFFRSSSQGNTPPDRQEAVNGDSEGLEDSTTKLVKRKSFGFVQIRKGKGPLNEGSVPHSSSSDLPADLGMELNGSPRKKRHFSQQINRPSGQPLHVQSRHASYGGDTAAKMSTESLTGDRRKRSFSRSRSRDTSADQSDKEGRRGFMGGVRRISLVGKHKRTVSGASGTGIPPPPPIPANPEEPVQDPSEEPPGMKTPSKSRSHALLPPIELQPPSPSRLPSLPDHSPLSLEPVFKPPKVQSQQSPSHASKAPSSLGRSSLPSNGTIVPRRNSLGDLKIPARISQAQVGLKRDLGMVREFALEVEQLKELQSSYNAVMTEVQTILDSHVHAQSESRATSPSFLNLPRPKSRSRSDTGATAMPSSFQPAYKQLASSFYTINSKYRIAWECAELLIDLGSGSTAASPASPPSTSASAPAMASIARTNSRKSRERAITLTGDDSKAHPNQSANVPAPSDPSRGPSPPLASPPNLGWRASTGRHDLSQRQLTLLREMLNNADSSFVAEDPGSSIPEEAARSTVSINREWRWGDTVGSTVTLPSEEDSQLPAKRRSKLKNLRDMLRSLKKAATQGSPQPSVPVSQTSLSTDSSVDSHPYHQAEHRAPGRRRAKTSSGPESMRSAQDRPNSPYMSLNNKASPRRPSLASIFRIGQKPRTNPQASGSSLGHDSSSGPRSASRVSSNVADDEDWDRLEAAGDLDFSSYPSTRKEATATIRGRSPYLAEALSNGVDTGKISSNASQTSLRAEASPRPTRLSNVEEYVDDAAGLSAKMISPSRQPSRSRRGGKTGSVRSMPPQQPDAKLAMTPENIKPLLENAKEVHSRLNECISEIRTLVEQYR